MPRSSLAPLLALALAPLLALAPGSAHAATVLVVSDAFTDTNIATALQADGHTVTLVTGDYMGGANPTLSGDLSGYDAVFWSATVNGFGGVHTNAALFTNLLAYVNDGGRVLVTGYDVLSYPDSMLIAFIGGSAVIDYPGSPGPIASIETSLTTGRVDLRGVTPFPYSFDYDAVSGLASDTLEIAGSTGFGSGGSQWTLRALGSGEIAYVSNGEYGVAAPPSWTTSTEGPQGAFNAAILNFAAASEGSASEPGAPRVRFTAPFAVDEGAEIEVRVEVSDDEGDPVTFSWDLDGDGAFGESEGMTSFVVPAGTTDGDGSYAIAVQASDGTHTTTRTRTVRVRNVAPSVTSTPPERVSVDEHLRYRMAITEPAGEHDPLTFTVTRGPGAVTAAGVYEWTPSEGDVTTGGREPIQVAIQIDDGDGGTAVHEWEMSVSPNHAPSAVIALYPVGIAVLEGQPRLAVQNATDLDGDELVYHFELDTTETFDSPDLQRATDVAQTPGYTAWTPERLHVGRWYWRASADDGIARSETAVVNFYVVPDPSMIPDAGPPADGGSIGSPDAGTGPDPEIGRGGCAVGTGGSPVGWLALLALALGARIARRRHT